MSQIPFSCAVSEFLIITSSLDFQLLRWIKKSLRHTGTKGIRGTTLIGKTPYRCYPKIQVWCLARGSSPLFGQIYSGLSYPLKARNVRLTPAVIPSSSPRGLLDEVGHLCSLRARLPGLHSPRLAGAMAYHFHSRPFKLWN